MKPRTYRGCILYPMGPNSWGGRWETYCNNTWLRADTLEGIRALIRNSLDR